MTDRQTGRERKRGPRTSRQTYAYDRSPHTQMYTYAYICLYVQNSTDLRTYMIAYICEAQTDIHIHGQCVCQSVGQMGTSRDRWTGHTAPPPSLPRLLCVCVYGCVSALRHTRTHMETVRQSDRGKIRPPGTHRIPIRWPTQNLPPHIMMYTSPASQPIATQSVSQTIAHRRLLDRWLHPSQPPLPACECVYV